MGSIRKAIIFISLFLPLLTNGQTYHPFPDTLARWCEQGSFCWNCTSQDQCNGDGWVYDVDGHIIIGGLKYALIGQQSAWGWMTMNNKVISAGNDSVVFPGSTIGAIREDSLNRVWYRPLVNYDKYIYGFSPCQTILDSALNQDILLYDFGMHVGDTFHLTPTDYEILSDIDSVQIGNDEYRRRFNFGQPYGSWIEGIGSESGLFGSYYVCQGECSGQGLCSFGIKDSSIYPYSGTFYNCNHTSRVVLSVKDLTVDINVEVFPQPTNDNFTISLSSLPANTTLSIFNIVGQQVYRQKLSDRSTVIQTSEVGVPGIYIVKVTDGSNNTFIRKVVIQ